MLTYKQEYYQKNKVDITRKKREYRRTNLKKVREQERQARLRNSEAHRKVIRQRTQRTRTWLAVTREEQGCRVCGERDPRCLDFHHKDPKTKEFCVGAGRTKAFKSISKEIEKCEVLCSNCHRKLHWELPEEESC